MYVKLLENVTKWPSSYFHIIQLWLMLNFHVAIMLCIQHVLTGVTS